MSRPGPICVDVKLRLGDFLVDMAFASQERTVAVFGPSGSGKTTLLHVIAGLLKPDQGRIEVMGQVLADTAARIAVPAHRRRLGLVFQDSQLFPHLTVRQNLAFGRHFAVGRSPTLDENLVAATLGIEHLLDRRPARLSGGEKQRVAVARAILSMPQMLLLDEPLAALDDERRLESLALIERIRDQFSIPMLYVTHRADEVRRLADCVIRIDRGKVVALGRPDEILAKALLSG